MSLKHTQFETVGSLAFGSITNAYQTVLALTDDAQEVLFFNSTEVVIIVQLPQIINNALSSVEALRMPPSSGFVYDGRTNNKTIPKGNIKIKFDAAPTTGEFSVSAIR